MAVEEVLEKIEEQLRCSVCLETYTNPKQLLCHHVYCVDCLRPPLVKSRQGQLSVTCPLCRHVTPVPPEGVAGLQSAVHVTGLLEIRDSVTKIPGGEELDRSNKRSIQLQQELNRTVEELDRSNKKSIHLEQELDKTVEKLDSRNKKAIHLKQELDKTVEKLDSRNKKAIHLKQELDKTVEKLDSRNKKAIHLKQELDKTVEELDRRNKKSIHLEQELDKTVEELNKKSIHLEQELDKTVEEFRQQEQKIDRAREELLRLELEKLFFKLEHAPFDARLIDLLGVFRVKMHNHCKSKTTCGVAVSISGMIVTSDEAKHCIIASYPSQELRSFGTHGSALGQLNSPRGVAVDGEGNILVADCNNHRIQKFTKHGEFLQAVGSKGSGRLHFVYPKDIVVNPITKMVYVVDAKHHVQVLNSDLTFFKNFGTHGQGRRQFSDPHGIACDSTGKVYVADTGNHRIQVFTSKGEFILMFGHHGDGIGELDYPYSLVVDHRDLVYVSEYNNNRVSVFTLDGLFRTRIGGNHFFCNVTDNLFTKPRGLAVSESGVMYVSDENSIQAITGIMYATRVPKKDQISNAIGGFFGVIFWAIVGYALYRLFRS